MMSFLRSVIARKPSRISPMSPGVEPAVRVDRLGGRGGLVEVAAHHVRTAGENLAVGGDRDFDSRNWLSNRTDPEILQRVDGDHRRGLGEAVPLENRQTRRVEELVDLRRERRASRHEVAQSSARPRAQLREDEALCEAVLRGEEPSRLTAGELHVRPPVGNVATPEEDPLLHRAAGERILEDARVHLLVQPRDREHESGPHFGHVERYGVHGLGVGDANAHVEHQVVTGHPLEDVRQRQKAEAGVIAGERNRRRACHDVRVDVVVGEHHPFRVAGRPRRVDDRREVVRTNLSARSRNRSGFPSASAAAPAVSTVSSERSHAVGWRAEADDMSQRGTRGAHRGDLRRLIVDWRRTRRTRRSPVGCTRPGPPEDSGRSARRWRRGRARRNRRWPTRGGSRRESPRDLRCERRARPARARRAGRARAACHARWGDSVRRAYLQRVGPPKLLDRREEELIERTGRGIPRTTRRHHRRPRC